MAVKVKDPRNIQGAYDDMSPQKLREAETNTDQSYIDDGIEKLKDYANDESNHQPGDLGEVARQGGQTSGTWADNTSKPAASGGGFIGKAKMAVKRKGAIGLIVALLGVGGVVPFLGSAALPFAIIGNMDSKSLLLGLNQYSEDYLGFKVFGTSKASVQNGAKGKLAGLTSQEVSQLEKNGVKLQGAKTNSITRKTTFTAVQVGNGGWIGAGDAFNNEMRTNSVFRKAMIYDKGGYWKASKSKAASKVKSVFRTNPNPDLSGKTTEEQNKKMYTSSVEGTQTNVGSSVNNAGNVDEAAYSDAAAKSNEISGDLKDEIDKQKEEIAEGKVPPGVAADSNKANIATALDKESLDVESATKGTGGKMWSYVNGLGIADTVCTTYQVARTVSVIARTYAMANIVRFAMTIRATIERAKAGDDDGQSVQYLMSMIQRNDPTTGQSFDATSYASFLFSGELSSEPGAVSAFGGQSIVALNMGLHALHAAIGFGDVTSGKRILSATCGAITNLGVQIVFTIGSLFTGGLATAAQTGIKASLSAIPKLIIEKITSKFGKEAIKKVAGDITEQGALKYFSKQAWRGFKTMWNGMSGWDKVGLLVAGVSTFGVGYIVSSLSGADIAGYTQNGFAAFDAVGTGWDKYESTAGIASGGTVATYGDTLAYQPIQNDYENRYSTDMRELAKNSPLDISNPYSALGSMVMGVQKTIGLSSSLSFSGTLGSILTLPLKLPGLGLPAHAADNAPTPAAIADQISDPYMIDNKVSMTVTGSPKVTFFKTMTFEDFIDKFVDVENPMVFYHGDDEKTGAPKFEIANGSELYTYDVLCHNPEKTELDPNYVLDDSSNLYDMSVCSKNRNAEFDDAIRFINQTNAEEKLVVADNSKPGSTSTGEAGEVAMPLGDAHWKANQNAYLRAHLPTGTAWGGDSMGTTNKGAGIALDLMTPEGTKVYAMFGGTVTSTNLCGAQDGMAIKSNIQGGTLGIAYMHGKNKKFKVGQTVSAGDYIMDVGTIGCNVWGSHLHIGMAFNGKYICPQDVFLDVQASKALNFAELVGKGVPICGRQ